MLRPQALAGRVRFSITGPDSGPQGEEEIAAAQARVREQTAVLRAERSQLVGQLRKQGWTLGRLAQEFGVTRTRIQQYEAGDGDG